jgi:hypothetical protein
MGYIRHQSIIVTGQDDTKIGGRHDTFTAREKAIELGLPCSEIVKSNANAFTSFLMAPDGSRAGWETSNIQAEKRKQWIEWVRKSNLGVDWAYVSFGGDDAQLAALKDWNAREL